MTASTQRLAVVTGGTRGIGGAIAGRLIRDGHRVIFTGTAADRPDGLHPEAEYVSLDIRDRNAASGFAGLLTQRSPDVLVNNVGLNIKGPTASFEVTDYETLLDVNLRAPFLFIRAVLPGMISRGWGRIVNITSLWGVSGNAEDAAYCASKFGLDGLTASVAAEVAGHGVLVNSIAPGFIMTEAAEAAYSPEDLIAVTAEIPVGRLGQPSEVAALASWLVSDENSYMSGQNLLIDGGLTRTAKP